MNYNFNAVKKAGPLLLAAVLSLGVLQKAQANYVEVDSNSYRTIKTYYFDDGRPYYRYRTNNYGPMNERAVYTVFSTNEITKKILFTRTSTSNYSKDEWYDTDGLPYKYTKQLTYGAPSQRSIAAIVTVNASTGLYKQIKEVTDTETRLSICDSNGLPYYTYIQKIYGPAYGRTTALLTTYNSNTELPTYSKETNALGKIDRWYDGNGLLIKSRITNTYGVPGERVYTILYTTNSNTGLPKQHVATTQYTKSVCTYNSSGFITKEVKTTTLGPVNNRSRTTSYSLDATTGIKKYSISISAHEVRKMIYSTNNGLPLFEIVQRAYGPSSLRNSTRILTTNTNTGMLSKSVEVDAMKTVTTTYGNNGEKKQALISRKYGLAGSRTATVTYSVSTTTGLTYKAIETSSAEVKTCYYGQHGEPTKMIINRNYGPAAKRNATILYSCNSSTGLVTQSIETTSSSVKKLYHNSNGVAYRGTLTNYTGSASMRNFAITITSDSATGKYKQERYENQDYSIRLDYNSAGVPNKRRTYMRLFGSWMLLSTDILNDGDEVGSTEVVAAAVTEIEQKENSKKGLNDLPEAELEYEEVTPKCIPISGKRLGIPQYMQMQK